MFQGLQGSFQKFARPSVSRSDLMTSFLICYTLSGDRNTKSFKTASCFHQEIQNSFLILENMVSEIERRQILALVKREVVPAIGCTEPVAVALCVAKATETLGEIPERIEARLSANILKNAMGVGIPGTGMTGLPIAIALGALTGRSAYGLEVLKDVCPDAVERGRRYIDEGRITIALKDAASDKLYIEVQVFSETHEALAVISGSHTRFVRIEKDGQLILDAGASASEEDCGEDAAPELNLAKVWEFATTAPLDEISFILEAGRLNKAAAEHSFEGSYGHNLGKILKNSLERQTMGDSSFTRILSYTSAACDVRMAGEKIPVMSNSGSGNQGIAATVPVVIYAEERGSSEERLTRALMLSHLTAIYIKQSLGSLSALCGCVVAATGSSCGITYLMGGTYRQICSAVKNMIANLTGMICDGAKPSCALKISSGVSTAVLSALMAMEDECVSPLEGIIDDDVDQCIRNLTAIGRDGMNETDRMILDIMTHKR